MFWSSCQPWPANQIGCLPTTRSTSRTPSLNGRRGALPRHQSSFGRCRRYSGRDNVAKPIRRSADTVVCKEKQLVLDDGSAHIATELLALELPTANINTSNANAIVKID